MNSSEIIINICLNYGYAIDISKKYIFIRNNSIICLGEYCLCS